MLKQYGIVGTRGRGPWVQGNNVDYVFFSPDQKPLTHAELKEVVPEPTEKSQNSIRWRYTVAGAAEKETLAQVATKAMEKILQLYPPKDQEAIRIPWQLNAGAAVHFASYEDRRIVLVSADKHKISPALAASLADPAVLHKHRHNYVFLKAGPDVPAELRAAMKKAGPDGLVIIERPGGPVRGKSPWAVMKVLAVAPGAHTPDSLLHLLDRHARPPGWDVKLSVMK